MCSLLLFMRPKKLAMQSSNPIKFTGVTYTSIALEKVSIGNSLFPAMGKIATCVHWISCIVEWKHPHNNNRLSLKSIRNMLFLSLDMLSNAITRIKNVILFIYPINYWCIVFKRYRLSMLNNTKIKVGLPSNRHYGWLFYAETARFLYKWFVL